MTPYTTDDGDTTMSAQCDGEYGRYCTAKKATAAEKRKMTT